jgi:predicted acylesterase/phospholipase RssA/CRP-like cAMP-binding protein
MSTESDHLEIVGESNGEHDAERDEVRQPLVDALRAVASTRQLARGDELCREGDDSDVAYLVLGGSLAAMVRGHAGDVCVAIHGPGALVGEVTAMIGGHRTATLVALDDCEVATIERAPLVDAFAAHPDAADHVLRSARERTDRSRVAALLSHELQAPDGAAVAAIAERVTWVQLTAGDTLFEAGDAADAAYLVVSGRLGVVDPPGSAPALVEIGRGGIVGEFGLLEGRSRSATVIALRDSSLARLSAADFRSISADHTALAMGLVRRILDRSGQDHSTVTTTRTFTIVTTGADQRERIRTITNGIVDSLRPFGATIVLDAERVDRLLGQPGIADTPSGSFGEVRLAELLHQVENDAEHVVLVADGDRIDGGWTQRALHHTDQVVIVTSADPDRDEERRIESVLASVHEHIPVWLALKHVDRPIRAGSTRRLRERFDVTEVHHLRRGDASDLARLGRLAGGRGVALVLSGGGARGHAHIGVFRALTERGVPIDRVVGASMGSIVAGCIAQQLRPHQLLADMCNGAERLLDYTVPIVSLIKGERIVGVLADQFGDTEIDDLPIPFACVSTDLTTAQVIVHRTGPVATMIRTSVSIPGVLPPVVHGTHLLADGGILDNLPVGVVASDPSIATIIASDVAPPVGPSAKSDYGLSVSGWKALRDKATPSKLRRRQPVTALPGIATTLMRSLLIGSSKSRDEHLASGAIDLYLDLDLRGVALLDFAQVVPAADRGYESALPMIDEWLAAHPALATRPDLGGR